MLIDKVKKTAEKNKSFNFDNIVCLESLCENEVVDFYLTQSDKKVNAVRQNMSLRAVYSRTSNKVECELNIHDFSFIKCLGKGGTSDVFLGKQQKRQLENKRN